MGVLSFIFNLLVVIWAICILFWFIPFGPNNLLPFLSSFVLALLAGLVLQIISRKRSFSDNFAKASGYLVILNIILMFCFIFYPDFLAMQNASKNSDVHEIAHYLQTATEDFKRMRNGERPASVRDIEGLLPEKIKNRKNPFNRKQTYTVSGGGLVDGEPTRWGEIGYIAPKDSTKPYQIITFRTGDTLRLIEELATVKVDSSGTKSP